MLLHAIIGGALIAIAALALFHFNRQICGISGMIEGVLPPQESDWPWRFSFLGGLVFGGILLRLFYPDAFVYAFDVSFPIIALGGFLVGFGARLGLGCTSGHGICGVGRFSFRSILASIIFVIAGMATATYFRLGL